MIELLAAAFFIGLASSGHCLLMCGGLTSALANKLSQRSRWQALFRLVAFHIGRITSYGLLGLGLGSAFYQLVQVYPASANILRYLAAIMIIITGLYIFGIRKILLAFEKRFGFIWQALQRFVGPLLNMRTTAQSFALGLLWAFLPCGMIYSTLLWASSQVQGPSAGLLMAAFGLGTLPSLLLVNIGQQQLMQKLQTSKKLLGLILIAFGLVSFYYALPLQDHSQHSNHSPAAKNSKPVEAAMQENNQHHHH